MSAHTREGRIIEFIILVYPVDIYTFQGVLNVNQIPVFNMRYNDVLINYDEEKNTSPNIFRNNQRNKFYNESIDYIPKNEKHIKTIHINRKHKPKLIKKTNCQQRQSYGQNTNCFRNK